MRFLSLFILLFFSLNIYGQNYSNAGKEFWVGYGHNSLFDIVNGGANTQEMVLYIGSNQDAVVTVSINGTPYSITYNIPGFTVIQTTPIPKAGANDPRLTAEGLNSRGIHIVSDVPIVAYAHQYGLNSSGATMLMPVETYGYTYFSVNYTQLTNVNVPCYSWFYAVASENNTRLQITPSVATQGGRPAGVPFTVNLNKGEIYNVFGASVTGSGTGLDITGSKIQSIAGADGKCHPIGVFSGSSRITICGVSGDILQQQIFPSSAWGTNFYTYPTINTTNINQTNLNYYRIAVRDPATKVKRNGVLLTGLINNFYYEYSSSTGDFIEANKPILVSQYVPSMQFCNIYNGNGDPEMFYLSPLQQAVNETYFYNTNNQNILDNYVSIITKTAGVSSLLIDGFGVVGSVTPHPQNNEYSVIVQALNGNQQHIIKGDSTFTAITYGFGNFESYGYNAGTLINNLDIIPSIKNTFSSGTKPSAYACLNSPFNISITMAYKATKMVWKFSQINIPTPKIAPGYDTTLINPVPYDSVIIDSRLYYKYKLPNNYVLNDTGTFNIPISITAPEIDNCNNTLDFIYSVRVNEVPKPSISVNYSTCLQDTAFLLTTGIAGFPIQNFIWTFDDGTQNFTQNPRKRFPTIGPHPIKLRLITYEGCISDTIINTVTNPNPTTTFGIATLPACEGSTLTFTDTSVFGGKLGRWYWDFGNGQTRNNTVNTPQTATYTTPGLYTIKHLVQSTGSCASDTAKKTIQIFAKPVAKFASTGGCLFDSTVRFTDSSKVSDGQLLNYLWDFGDPNANGTNPNTSTLKNPTHKYIVSGTYTVKLTVTTANGCSNIYTNTVTIFPLPTTNFTINNAAQCVNGNGFLFTNTTTITGGVLSYLWNFGDGGTSTLQNPSHVYTSAGNYNVMLISTSNNGCKDTIVKVVTVYPKPNPLFNINQTTQCENGNSFIFNNTSSISSGTLSYNWYFGDGTSSTQTNPVKVYSAFGTYVVKLVVTSDKGCKDSITRTVTVNEKPFVDFTIAIPVQCGNALFNFIDLSKITNGSLSFKWYFGDGATSTSQNPTHSYITPGVYAVKLVVTSNNGCKDSVTKSVTSLAPPVAGFNVVQSQCLVGNNFVFQNTSTTPTGTMSFVWDFADGVTSTAINPTHSYIAAGIYIVKLSVTTTNGCKGLFADTLTVHAMPKASFNISTSPQCITGNSFSFTNNSTLTTGTTTFLWTFGDGSFANTQNATHSYTTQGTYNVKLLIISQQGCKDSITKSVVVNPKPIVNFNINTIAQCVTNNNFSFTNTSSISSGTLTYQWFFGDGTSSITQNANHTYTTSGTFQVKLIATSNNGCKDSITQNVTVGPKPTAGFNINTANQCVNANNFIFFNTSSITTGTITYQWYFGDGGSSVLQNPSYSYSIAGTYNVRLIVNSNNGCIDSIKKTITVYPKPVSSFTVNNSGQCITGNTFSFTNTSTISSGILTYQWLFGDGGVSTLQNAVHSYTTVGSYVVKLICISANGCRDTTSKNVAVYPKPSASFSINDTSQCLSGNNFAFTNLSTVSTGLFSSFWNFGDATTSTSLNPIKSYSSVGIYIVKLSITSDKGCIDSIKKTVYVNPKPAPAFNINNNSQCLKGNSFSFTNSTPNNLGALSYIWSFGDGSASNLINPVHVYTVPGTYNVKLVAVAGNGCKDSIIQSVVVNPQPLAAYNISNAAQCLNGNSFIFTNASTVSSGTMTYNWFFGDGNNSIAQNPVHVYNNFGSFLVKLVVVTNNGCKDSLTKNAIVYPKPNPAFSINTSAQCIGGNSFTFTNSSVIGSGTMTYFWKFGDGTFSSLQNVIHSYTLPGIYNVTLVATSNNLCKDSVTKSITVYPKPKADFTVNNLNQCFENNSFNFTNTSTLASGTMTYDWSFGDGTNSTNTNAVYSYSLPGNYVVRLIVTSSNGCKDTAIKNVIVYGMPVANFNINTASQCRLNNSFIFTNTSTVVSPATYNWSFGDGNTSALQSPTHTYSSHGNFIVRLIVISANGCRDTISKPVVVYPMPTASFNISKPAQCLKNNLFQFLNTSTISSGSLLFQWYFGDGTSANTISPVHTYTAAGVYNVKLIVTTGFGCKDSTTRQVTVDVQSIPDFTINKSNQCLNGNSFSFTNISSVQGVVAYNWSFGDGGTSTAANAVHSYASAGVYNVMLQVVTSSGCLDTLIRPITVYPQPNVSYNVNNVSQCLPGNLFSFTNNSIPVTGVSFLWNFGDGITSTSKNPIHVYTAAGSYDVVLRVTTNFGCFDSLVRSVKVNPKPNALFTINTPNQCYNGNTYSFSNNNTVGTNVTYLWTFGDGTISTVQNATHVYNLPGSYTVKLKITTENGCIDSSSKTVLVYVKPTASFAPNNTAQCLSGNSFVFSNNSTIGSGSFSSLWNFGDGQTSTAISPLHSYSLPGTYKVKLVVTSNNGCKDSTVLNVIVNSQPQASFIINNPGQCVSGNLFSFTNTSVSEGTSNYFWTFGDGTSSSAFSPLHAYSASGIYNVKLVITSAKGCKDSIVIPLTVYPKPLASFTINLNAQCLETNNFLFANNSTVASGSFTSLWNFGDGSVSSLNNASHTYATGGTYNVKLVVTSDKGCKDSTLRNVVVNPQPTADFNINDTAQCLKGNLFRFTDASQISANGVYQWNFGDGNSSLAQNPVHTYTNAGTYTVLLKIFTVAGCTDSIIRRVVIYPDANASFNVNQTAQCLKGNNFLFNNTSTVIPGTLSSFWNFGDGVTSILPQPTHSYSISGNYAPQLVVTTDKGCLDTFSVNIVVNPNPSALFNINNDKQCLRGNNFSFINSTTGASLNYNWSFGDGATSLQGNTNHTYGSSGTYTVQLIATSTASCRDTVIRTVVVHPMPTAAFSITANGNCSNNNNYTFSNTSSLSNGTLNYIWSFGDGINSNNINPTHTYSIADTFAVQLIALSEKGCRDTTKNNIIVIPKPAASFTINKIGQCVNDNNYIFTNTSTALTPTTFLWRFGNGGTATSLNANTNYSTEGNYTVQLLVNGAGCTDSVSKTITVYPKPMVSFDINNTVQCLIDNNFILTNKTLINTGTLTYTWLLGDGSISTQPNPVHAYIASGNYTIKQIATSNFNCVDSASQNIQVLVNPRARFSVNNNTQCFNNNNFVFTNNSIAPAGTTFTWSFGDGTLSYNTSPTKVYKTAAAYKVSLYLTGTNGCQSDTATTSVSVIPNPIVNAGEDVIVTEGKTVRLNAKVDNGLTFQWSPSTYLNSTSLQNPLVTPFQNIGYRLLAIGQNGCTGSDSVYVKILKSLNIPNVFSPNGDGVNDKWIIRSLSDYPGCTVEVFNRYGSLVFSSIGYKNPWDGTKNGNPLPAGVYYYIVDPKNGIDKVAGNVTILR